MMMHSHPPRTIRSHEATEVLPDLLQSLLALELLRPSSEVWLVSPWITDITIIGNEAGQFAYLAPHWELRRIRLSEILQTLAARGSRVLVATRDDGKSDSFLNTLKTTPRLQVGTVIECRTASLLHEKGLLARDRFFLSGSFNFTYSGIRLNEEAGVLRTDPAEVAENAIAFRERWG